MSEIPLMGVEPEDSELINPLQSIADSIQVFSPEQERSAIINEISGDFIHKGSFENDDKVERIVKSVLVEGKVMFEIEWKRAKNRIHSLNTMVSEQELKENLKPRTFNKLVKEYVESDD